MSEANAIPDNGGDDVRLTDVMLAMDVVDTLRHEEALVARALNVEERERVLLERVRSAYEAQGIDVSDATLEAGVRALKDKEFRYEPPPSGLRTRLFRAWVGRGRIGRGAGLFGIVAALIGGGWYGFVELPAERERSAAITELNIGVDRAGVELRTLEQRRQSLNEAVAQATLPGGSAAVAAETVLTDTRASLADAGRALADASALTLTTRYTPANFDSIGSTGQAQLTNQQRLLARARSTLDEAAASLALVSQLRGLPQQLTTLRDDVIALAVPASIDADANALHDSGQSALRQGDAGVAMERVDDLEALLAELEASYDISVVSRPGQYSGVIRAPESNPNVDNYYLIVEALDRDGRPFDVAVRSEEDGVVRTVRAWGVRVGKPVFDRIAADKRDDGIIQSRLIGRKARGYVEPEYTVPVAGGLIHQW